MELDASGWSGDGAFTQVLLEALKAVPAIELLKVEDAPATRSDSAFSFVSNEIYVRFGGQRGAATSIPELGSYLETCETVGAPDYTDEGMLQYLRTERVIPPYQTRGYKLIELVRIYQAGAAPRR